MSPRKFGQEGAGEPDRRRIQPPRLPSSSTPPSGGTFGGLDRGEDGPRVHGPGSSRFDQLAAIRDRARGRTRPPGVRRRKGSPSPGRLARWWRRLFGR